VSELRSPIRVAVSGAHGVGKTTFCRDLKATLESRAGRVAGSVELVTEVARTLSAEGIPINRETAEDQYALFFEKHISNLFRETQADFVVYDRTILDSIAYATTNGNLAPPWIQFTKTVSQHVLNRIDVYFFIPIEIPLHDDGVRHTDADYQSQLDNAIMQVLRECRPSFTIVTGTREQRVHQALNEIYVSRHGTYT